MDTREDSIPFRFTPDGLDEATIDALIGETYAQASDGMPIDTPAVRPKKRSPRRRANGRTAHSTAA